MNDTSCQSKKTPVKDLCESALEHYDVLSDQTCSYNSLIPEAIKVYQRVREYYDELKAEYDSWTWQKGFNPNTASELWQLEEFLGYDSSHTTVKEGNE